MDRPLTAEEMAELRALSGRAEITATSFVDEYHGEDFGGDPAGLVERYFDAFLYFADWGTRHLMIRVPRGLVDLELVEQYCHADCASFWTTDEHVILSLIADVDSDDWTSRLGSIAHVRSELASGDLRLLYLAWLLAVQADEVDDDELEPPLPPNLGSLSAPLRAASDFLCVNEDLLEYAAQASPEVRRDLSTQADLTTWVRGLPPVEKDALLVQAARGEGARVQAILHRRFHAESPAGDALPEAGKRTAGDLWTAATG